MTARRLAPALALSLLTLVACEHRRPAEAAAAPGASADAATSDAAVAAVDGAGGGTSGQAQARDGGVALPPVAPPSQGLSGQKKILFEPAHPAAGKAFTVRAGPITFRNGCEGIARTDVKREGPTITVTWTPKQVPPDAMCTMALHDDWIVAKVGGVPAGTYTVRVNAVGETTLVVGGT